MQVGGGAFAACVGATGPARRFHAVQAEGCAPLATAWQRAIAEVTDPVTELVAPLWSELMTPWPDPHSLADGILDDETYDWLGVFEAIGARSVEAVMLRSSPPRPTSWRRTHLAGSAGFDVSPTGSAGLAGLLAVVDAVGPTERVAVVMSGVAR